MFGAEGVDTAALLEGLIAQGRAAYGRLEGPVAAAVGSVPSEAGSTTLVMKVGGTVSGTAG